MHLWFIFALLSIFALCGSEISQKISLTQKVDISAITNNFYVWTFQGLVGLVLALLSHNFILISTPIDLLKLLAVAIMYFLGGTFFYTSYKGNSPSISVILGSVSVLVSTTLGVVFFKEGLVSQKILGIILIMVSIIILNLNKKDKINKYNVYALIGGICFGTAYTLDKSFALNLHPFNYLAFVCLTIALISIITKYKLITSESRNLHLNNFYPMIFSASFGSAFNIFTFFSYRNGGNVGVIDAMNNSSVFLIILVELFLLRDRQNLKKKLICALLAFVGISLFSLLK